IDRVVDRRRVDPGNAIGPDHVVVLLEQEDRITGRGDLRDILEVDNVVVVRALHDERAGQAVGDLVTDRAVLVGVVPVSPGGMVGRHLVLECVRFTRLDTPVNIVTRIGGANVQPVGVKVGGAKAVGTVGVVLTSGPV